jgi:hypothetical protein
MQVERRKRRSDRPIEATRLYLEHLAARGAFSALALADADGLLIAGTRGGVDAETVAAVAPLVAADPHADPGGLLRLVTRGQPLRIWDVDLDGAPCFLAGVGGDPAAAGDAAHALRRILVTRPAHC